MVVSLPCANKRPEARRVSRGNAVLVSPSENPQTVPVYNAYDIPIHSVHSHQSPPARPHYKVFQTDQVVTPCWPYAHRNKWFLIQPVYLTMPAGIRYRQITHRGNLCATHSTAREYPADRPLQIIHKPAVESETATHPPVRSEFFAVHSQRESLRTMMNFG